MPELPEGSASAARKRRACAPTMNFDGKDLTPERSEMPTTHPLLIIGAGAFGLAVAADAFYKPVCAVSLPNLSRSWFLGPTFGVELLCWQVRRCGIGLAQTSW